MGLLECAPRATALRTERIFLTMALLDDAEATRKTATVCVHQRRLTLPRNARGSRNYNRPLL
jgi:hypothetical protein